MFFPFLEDGDVVAGAVAAAPAAVIRAFAGVDDEDRVHVMHIILFLASVTLTTRLN